MKLVRELPALKLETARRNRKPAPHTFITSKKNPNRTETNK